MNKRNIKAKSIAKSIYKAIGVKMINDIVSSWNDIDHEVRIYGNSINSLHWDLWEKIDRIEEGYKYYLCLDLINVDNVLPDNFQDKQAICNIECLRQNIDLNKYKKIIISDIAYSVSRYGLW